MSASENQTVKPACRLVVCFDGTWNTVESRTNVSRLFEAILDKEMSDDDVEQLKFYDEGVGSSAEATTPWGKIKDALMGGIFGDGLQRNVLQAYCWLIEHFGEHDYTDDNRPEIYIFGFSRGAFTARLLAGLLGACGLLKKDAVLPAVHPQWQLTWNNPVIQLAWSYYKPGQSMLWKWQNRAHGRASEAKKLYESHDALRNVSRAVPVMFLGVWDTVGKYGLPSWSWKSAFFKPISFQDDKLGRHVLHAVHAMAIDEHRADFNVRPWTGVSPSWASAVFAMPPGQGGCGNPLPYTKIQQRWFAGSHAQVGGGYENDQLCHHSLSWMAQEARKCGLRLKEIGETKSEIKPNPLSWMAQGAKKYGLRLKEVGESDDESKPIFRFTPLTRDHLAPVMDSHAEFAYGLYRWISDPIMRQIHVGSIKPGSAGEYEMTIDIDPSVSRKVAGDASYRPVNLYHQGRLDVHSFPDVT